MLGWSELRQRGTILLDQCLPRANTGMSGSFELCLNKNGHRLS